MFKSAAAEAARAANGLVKIVCSEVQGDGKRVGQFTDANLSSAAVLGTRLEASCLHVWFPAHWAYCVSYSLADWPNQQPLRPVNIMLKQSGSEVPQLMLTAKALGSEMNVWGPS